MRLTVGPLPASVYWRRRAIVLGGVLLVVFLVAQACIAASASQGEDSANERTPTPQTPTPGTSTPTSPAAATHIPAGEQDGAEEPDGGTRRPPSAAGDGEECGDADVVITAVAEPTEFSAGEQVRLAIRIRNGSDRTCRRDIGGGLRELRLLQGTGAVKVWSSQDCGGPTGSDDAALEPGHEVEYHLVWNGRSTDTCDGDEPAGPVVEPGAYQLFARLGSLHSDPIPITIR